MQKFQQKNSTVSYLYSWYIQLEIPFYPAMPVRFCLRFELIAIGVC